MKHETISLKFSELTNEELNMLLMSYYSPEFRKVTEIDKGYIVQVITGIVIELNSRKHKLTSNKADKQSDQYIEPNTPKQED